MAAPSNGHQQRRSSPASQQQQRWVPPHDRDAEASLLGGVMLHNEWLDHLEQVRTDDFYVFEHRVVWEAIRNLQHAGSPIDTVTLDYEIERAGKGDRVGPAFLGELALRVPTVDNVMAYAEIVRRDSRNRRAVISLKSIADRAEKWQHDPSELIGEIVGELTRLEDLSKPPAKRLKLFSVEESVRDLGNFGDAPVFATPFETVNDAIGFGGFLGTQVYTVAAGTGRGKTTWVASVGAYAAQFAPVLVVSYEMKPGYFIARKAAGVLGTHSNEILRGRVSIDDVLRAMPYPRMHLMHKPTLVELRDAVRWISDRYSAAPLVIVDYIQKLADEISLGMQRPDLRLATSQASAALCDIADRSRAAIVTVSAIGRGKNIIQHPRKHSPYDLVEVAKESGAVEYDGAGMIVLSLSKDYEDDERIGTMTVAKSRFGRELHVDARYNGARGTWRDVGEVVPEDAKDTDAARPATSRPSTPAREEREDVVRTRIVAELNKAPARTKTALKERVTGCRKEIVGQLITRMIDEGVIVQIGTGLTLSPGGRQMLMEVP